MIGPVELATCGNFLYSSLLNKVYKNSELIMRVEYKITSLSVQEDWLIICGRHNATLLDLKTLEMKMFKYKYMVANVCVHNNKFYCGTICGKIIDENGEKEFLETKSINSLSFFKLNVVTGNYNFVFIKYSGSTYKFFIHQGRVFDVQFNQYGFISAGEDRRIVVVDSFGGWCIQESRNYVVKCIIYKEYVVTINKNGTLKIYKSRLMIFKKEYTSNCLNTCVIFNGDLYLGLCNGKVDKISIEESSGKYTEVSPEFIMDCLNKNNFELLTNNETPSKEKKRDEFNLSKEKKQDEPNTTKEKKPHNPNNFTNYQICKNKIVLYKNNDIYKEICIKHPFCIKNKLIGTKNGWIFTRKNGLKICDEPILDLFSDKQIIHVHTLTKIYTVILRKQIINTDRICGTIKKNGKFFNIYETKSFRIFYRYKSNDDSFREVTCGIRHKDFLVCGTSENKIILFAKDTVIDSTRVQGSVSSITKSKNRVYFSTLNGFLVVCKIFKNKLFIVREIKNEYKIIDIYYNKKLYFIDSNGNIKEYCRQSRIRLIKNFFKYLTKIILENNLIYCCTSDGCLIIYDFMKSSTIIYKIDSASFHSLSKISNFLVFGGDSHYIYKFDLRNHVLNKKLAHSSFIKDIKEYFTVSNDGYLIQWTTNLERKRKFKVLIDNPNNLIIFNSSCYVLGLGIQKISIK